MKNMNDNENTKEREIEMINDKKWRIWTGNGIGESGARMISESLKTNTTLRALDLGGDEKWSKMKWIIIIMKKMKEWKEMKNINDNDNKKDIDGNDKW